MVHCCCWHNAPIAFALALLIMRCPTPLQRQAPRLPGLPICLPHRPQRSWRTSAFLPEGQLCMRASWPPPVSKRHARCRSGFFASRTVCTSHISHAQPMRTFFAGCTACSAFLRSKRCQVVLARPIYTAHSGSPKGWYVWGPAPLTTRQTQAESGRAGVGMFLFSVSLEYWQGRARRLTCNRRAWAVEERSILEQI